jgi:hypothetical protein
MATIRSADLIKVLRAPRRRVRFDGVIEEWSAATGRSFLIPANPRRPGIDVSVDAPGWEPLGTFLKRLRR